MTTITLNTTAYEGTMLETGITAGSLYSVAVPTSVVTSAYNWNSINTQALTGSLRTASFSLRENDAGDVVIETKRSLKLRTADGKEIDLIALASAMMELLDRATVLVPDLAKHEHYPALKQAFDHYRVLHCLMRDEAPAEES